MSGNKKRGTVGHGGDASPPRVRRASQAQEMGTRAVAFEVTI